MIVGDYMAENQTQKEKKDYNLLYDLLVKSVQKILDKYGIKSVDFLQQPSEHNKEAHEEILDAISKVVNNFGDVLWTGVVYPTAPQNKTEEAKRTILALINKFKIVLRIYQYLHLQH